MKNYSWTKLGLFIRPDTSKYWSRSHAMIPTPYRTGINTYRIYYSGRNDQNQSCIGFADIELEPYPRVVAQSSQPLMLPGRLGCFDDNGVTPSCVIPLSTNKFALYYIGWNPGSTVRMHLFGGLAFSSSIDGPFTRWSEAPLLERIPPDPFLNTAPWVVFHNEQFYMYYVSGQSWDHKDLPKYNIKIALSSDGITWKRNGHVCIDFCSPDEHALARPYVYRDESRWHMWYSYKGSAYRIGYAISDDGIDWRRCDEDAGIDTSPSGFDSEMIEYPVVIQSANHTFMLYNGNNYGYEGIGLAKLA